MTFQLQEYSPDLKPIHGKEKKSQLSSSEGGITITSIKQKPDNFVPSTSSTNNRQNSRTSTQSQQSHSSQQGYNNMVAESTEATTETVNTNASRCV